ncbi:Uncharacterized protein APZ42_001115, partial [Daphnia magna]
ICGSCSTFWRSGPVSFRCPDIPRGRWWSRLHIFPYLSAFVICKVVNHICSPILYKNL